MAPDLQAVPKLSGTIEADETYIGGQSKNRHANAPKQRRGGWDKATVVAMVERGGNMRSWHVPSVNMRNIGRLVRANVNPMASTLMTDATSIYRTVGPEFGGGHFMVDHGRKEYVRGFVTTNTVESAFSLLKRGLHGTFHSVSRKHLHRYLAEFDFRYNARRIDDGERTAIAIRSASGKRLQYKEQVAG
jgi:hypothetical protein